MRATPLAFVLAVSLLSGPALRAQSQVQADFNGDGFDDLAVGTPSFDNGSALAGVGAANVIFGSATGLSFAGNQRFVASNLNLSEAAFDALGAALAAGDFNGDGFDDLAIGVPGKDSIGGIVNSGLVAIVPGAATGLNTAARTTLTDACDGVENGDSYGSALIAADFNGDGFDDLAIGAPGETVGTVAAAGAVEVRLGSAAGLAATAQCWHQNSPGVLDAAETNDRFGAVLEAGDFNGDGRDDLAIATPTEDDDVTNSGVVQVLFGAAAGLTSVGDLLLSDACDGEEALDQYGNALAAGDFNGDGFDDLAVGVPFEDFSGLTNAGQVEVRMGSSTGLGGAFQCWNQNSSGVLDTAESLDGCGENLIAADFNDDGRDDLAIGAYAEDLGAAANAGGVNVLFGSATGLTSVGDLFLQDTVCDGPEANDNLGRELAAGDYNGDGRDDLAMGIPSEDFNGVPDAGAVQVTPGPLSGVTSQCWSQDTVGIIGVANPGDNFGGALGR